MFHQLEFITFTEGLEYVYDYFTHDSPLRHMSSPFHRWGHTFRTNVRYIYMTGNFPDSPVVKIPCFQCREYGFDPCLENWDSTCYMVWQKKKKVYNSLKVICFFIMKWVSLVSQMVKNLPAMWETWVWSLGWEDPLEKGKATHSSILAWKIPWSV